MIFINIYLIPLENAFEFEKILITSFSFFHHRFQAKIILFILYCRQELVRSLLIIINIYTAEFIVFLFFRFCKLFLLFHNYLLLPTYSHYHHPHTSLVNLHLSLLCKEILPVLIIIEFGNLMMKFDQGSLVFKLGLNNKFC